MKATIVAILVFILANTAFAQPPLVSVFRLKSPNKTKDSVRQASNAAKSCE